MNPTGPASPSRDARLDLESDASTYTYIKYYVRHYKYSLIPTLRSSLLLYKYSRRRDGRERTGIPHDTRVHSRRGRRRDTRVHSHTIAASAAEGRRDGERDDGSGSGVLVVEDEPSRRRVRRRRRFGHGGGYRLGGERRRLRRLRVAVQLDRFSANSANSARASVLIPCTF